MACALACLAAPAWAQQPQPAVVRGQTVEIGGGFAHTDFKAEGWPYVNGFYGSLGVNVTDWFQAYVEGSAQYGSIFVGNTRIYGDHIGGRFYYRPWNQMFNPFAEALVGVSRFDFNQTKPPAKYSQNGFSFKVGGGVDLNINEHWSVHAIDVDYYRTPFLQTHQNNLWISGGLVFKFGQREYP